MMNLATGLVPCATCKHEIGSQAENCPQCGSPNTWVHPRIQAFLNEAKNIKTKRPFHFAHKGAEIWGESESHSVIAYIGAVMIGFVGLCTIPFSLFVGPMICGVVLAVMWKLTARKTTFRANLVTGKWESTNDGYWKPVAEFLGVRI